MNTSEHLKSIKGPFTFTCAAPRPYTMFAKTRVAWGVTKLQDGRIREVLAWSDDAVIGPMLLLATPRDEITVTGGVQLVREGLSEAVICTDPAAIHIKYASNPSNKPPAPRKRTR